MRALDIRERCRRAGILLTVEGDQLAYDAPAVALTEDLLEAMRVHRADLLAIVAVEENAGREPEAEGWSCPRCGGLGRVFYGVAPDVSCPPCRQTRQTTAGPSRCASSHQPAQRRWAPACTVSSRTP